MRPLESPPEAFRQIRDTPIWTGPKCPECDTSPNWRKGYLSGCDCAASARRSRESVNGVHIIGEPENADQFADGIMAHYRECRRARMDHLAAVWTFAVWFDVAAAKAKAEGWGQVRELVDGLRRDGLGWRYATIRKYRSLARHPWKAVAKFGSVRKALEGIRAMERTPEEAKALKARKATTRNRDAVYKSRMQHLERENDVQAAQIRRLEEQLRILQAAADPATVTDLEAVAADHAKAEHEALRQRDAAVQRADAERRRRVRAEKEAAHLRASLRGGGNASENGRFDPIGEGGNGTIPEKVDLFAHAEVSLPGEA